MNEQRDLSEIWTELHAGKGDLLERCEQYSRWTVASAFPASEHEKSDTPEETQKGNVAIGARLVNHLAHRVVDTMFPVDRPFFAIAMLPEAKKEFEAEADADTKMLVQDAVANAENAAMRSLNLTQYRPLAVEAMVLKIITGNALIHRMSDGSRAVYSLRDYCCTRQINGKLTSTILKDVKKFRALPEHVQAELKESDPGIKDSDNVDMYTYYERKAGKWYMRQAVNDVELNVSKSYNDQDFPCLVLTWSLHRGDNYGRGLVEDYAVSFHNIDVLTAAIIDMTGIAADIKFLVNDASSFDVDQWNRAKRGEYVPGKEGDISVPQFKFAVEIQILNEIVAKLERELSQAFLLSSAGVRDAERVTAEEIRFFAREIESAFGGLYSRLALEWQKREAEYALTQVNFKSFFTGAEDQAFEAVVTTGLESLSREGKIDAMRLAFSDLQMMDTIPDEMRATMNPLKFMRFVFRQRDVNPDDFLFTEEELKKNAADNAAREEELIAQQGEAKVAAGAAAKQ